MNTVTLEPFQTVLLQRMEELAPLLVEKIQASNFLSPIGILLLSNPSPVKSSETPSSTSSSLEGASSMTTEDASCEIIDESTTSILDTVRRIGGSNASYLVIRPKTSRETRTESEQMPSPSSIPSSDLVSKSLVLHSVSITPELANALKKSGLEEIRLKSCTFKIGGISLSLFEKLERLYISFDPHQRHYIQLPSLLKMLVVYVGKFDSTKPDPANFYAYIDAEHCRCLEHM